GEDGDDEVGRIEPRGERPAREEAAGEEEAGGEETGGEETGGEPAGEGADGLPVPCGEPGARSLGATGRSVRLADDPPTAEPVAVVSSATSGRASRGAPARRTTRRRGDLRGLSCGTQPLSRSASGSGRLLQRASGDCGQHSVDARAALLEAELGAQ